VKITAYSKTAYNGTFQPIRIDIAVSVAVEIPSSSQRKRLSASRQRPSSLS